MPVYLLHGFRWPRVGFTGIRVHIIVHNLEDASAEYIQTPVSQAEILSSFRKAYPEIMKTLEANGKQLALLEQYDPADEVSENAVSQPWAFVADRVVTLAAGNSGREMAAAGSQVDVMGATGAPKPQATPASSSDASTVGKVVPITKTSLKDKRSSAIQKEIARAAALSLNVEEIVSEGPGLTSKAWEAFADLRDQIAKGEKIGWWIVYNGDPERGFDEGFDDEGYSESEEAEDDEGEVTETESRSSMAPSHSATSSQFNDAPIETRRKPVPSSTSTASSSTAASSYARKDSLPKSTSASSGLSGIARQSTASAGATAVLPGRPRAPSVGKRIAGMRLSSGTKDIPPVPAVDTKVGPAKVKERESMGAIADDKEENMKTPTSSGTRKKWFGR